jgi:catechol 2,3-dioxygenase-like lactoylglutathione lyase family enzyme
LRPRVLHTAFHVSDLDLAVGFYTGVLGMQEQMRFELPTGEWECVLVFPDGKGSGVILVWDPARTAPRTHGDGYSRLVIKVSDLEQAVEHLRQHGTKITVPPTQAPIDLRYAMFEDPDGYTIELLQLGGSRP